MSKEELKEIERWAEEILKNEPKKGNIRNDFYELLILGKISIPIDVEDEKGILPSEDDDVYG